MDYQIGLLPGEGERKEGRERGREGRRKEGRERGMEGRREGGREGEEGGRDEDVYIPYNLGISTISRLCYASTESQKCVPISRFCIIHIMQKYIIRREKDYSFFVCF